jgi:protein-S-isoprenylcysteine O-methyltransferase Ste14
MLSNAWSRVRSTAADSWAAVAKARAEILTVASFLIGWALLTKGVAALTAPVAWTFSTGLLLLSLCGWKFLWAVMSAGLYTLTREGDE